MGLMFQMVLYLVFKGKDEIHHSIELKDEYVPIVFRNGFDFLYSYVECIYQQIN